MSATTIATATTKAIIIPAIAPPLRPELFDLIKYLRLLLFDLSSFGSFVKVKFFGSSIYSELKLLRVI